MDAVIAAKKDASDPIEAIRCRILQRTWGRIDLLQVEMRSGQVMVRGLVYSFYDKQLAIQAVLDVTGDDTTMQIGMDIIVADHDRGPRIATQAVAAAG